MFQFEFDDALVEALELVAAALGLGAQTGDHFLLGAYLSADLRCRPIQLLQLGLGIAFLAEQLFLFQDDYLEVAPGMAVFFTDPVQEFFRL